MSKFLSLLAGAALLAGVSVANAAEPLTSAQMDTVVAGGLNIALARAGALAIGPNSFTATSANTVAIDGVGSASASESASVAF
jgi:hypothetical protein